MLLLLGVAVLSAMIALLRKCPCFCNQSKKNENTLEYEQTPDGHWVGRISGVENSERYADTPEELLTILKTLQRSLETTDS